MRKFFYGLGIFAAIVIVAGGIGFFVLARNGAALDTASKAYVKDSVVTIATNWDSNELWKRASPHLRTMAKQEELRGFFDAARDALGPLVEYRGSQGQSLMSVVNSQSRVSASYVAQCHFQKGDAVIQVALVKQGDTWMIEGFHINSSVLMKRLVGLKS
ncbi:MAG: hypothetical protein WBD48_05075 [Pseudolabrys sp.]